MRPARIVIDASALLDTAPPGNETWHEAYRYLRGQYEICAPELIASETGNAVHGRRRDEFGSDAATRSEFLEVLLAGIDRLLSDPSSRARAGTLAGRLAATYYDSEYAEMALRDEDALLITHDGALLEAVTRGFGPGRALTLDQAAERIAAGEL